MFGNRVSLVRKPRGLLCIKPDQASQFSQETAFLIGLPTVGVTNADRHLVGQLTMFGLRQHRRRCGQVNAFQQHVLIQLRQVRRIRIRTE